MYMCSCIKFLRLDYVAADLLAVPSSRVGGKERGLSWYACTLLHQIGQSAPNLYDFVAAQVGQIAWRVHHPRMNAAEHIAERLLYFVIREHPAMFWVESCDRGKVHAAKIRHVFGRRGYYKGLQRKRRRLLPLTVNVL